jgi:predicted NAD/FAD-binding protein
MFVRLWRYGRNSGGGLIIASSIAPRQGQLDGMKVAVVGSGVSGIGAVWALNEYSEHDVHLFEADEYLGGHTHTVQFHKGTATTNVDTGFIVAPPQIKRLFLAFIDG